MASLQLHQYSVKQKIWTIKNHPNLKTRDIFRSKTINNQLPFRAVREECKKYRTKRNENENHLRDDNTATKGQYKQLSFAQFQD